MGTSQISRKENIAQPKDGPMVGNGLVGVQRDGEESDFVAVGELRLVGSTLLEHQVSATIGGSVGAEGPKTRSIVYSELEGRELLSDGLRRRVRALWRWSAGRSGMAEGNSMRSRRRSHRQ